MRNATALRFQPLLYTLGSGLDTPRGVNRLAAYHILGNEAPRPQARRL
jgi:hypothetical protein